MNKISKNNINIGIVGIGNMGSAHAANIFSGNIKGLELGALCDIDKSKRVWAEKSLGNIPFFESYEDMIKSGLINAVLISVPHYLHPDIAIYAFENNLHVITEKPAGVYVEQVKKMNRAAEISGRAFGIMYNQRANPVYRKVHEIVHSGQLGELKRCVWIITNWYRTQSYYDSMEWRATWSGEGGGILVNQCPHNLDLWQWIFGLPTRIRGFCGYGKYHDIETEDDITVYAEYANGATGVFISSTGEFPGTNRLEISGSKGKILIENGKIRLWELSGSNNSEINKTDILLDKNGNEHNSILQNFTNAILHGEELIASGFEGIHGVNISNAVHMSDWLNKTVEFPVDSGKFQKMLEEKAKTSLKNSDKNIYKNKSFDFSKAGVLKERWEVKW